MTKSPETPSVIHNPDTNRFEIWIDQNLARLDYAIDGNKIIFKHTEVPPDLEGRGIGSKLAQAGLGYARAKGYTVIPLCEFISSYIQRHPEFQDLL